MSSTRNAGSVHLARLGKTETQIGSEVGVSKVTAHHWKTGEKKPREEKRARLRELYKIPVDAWDRQPEIRAPRVASEESPADDDVENQDDALAMIRRLAKLTRRQLKLLEDELGNDDGKTSAEQGKALESLGRSLERLLKLTGEDQAGIRLTRLPAWHRTVREIKDALRPFPEAAAAVAARFMAIEQEHTAA